MVAEVAVFIDIENLRYGLLNNYGQEPDIRAVVEKAKKYGRPSLMRGYADFTEHPPELTRQLQVAGIEAINVPVKRRPTKKDGKEIERVKNAADMILALDAMIEALEADEKGQVKVFLLVTGDRDYVKLVTHLRNRFGQRVVIAGVPGSVSRDLVTAAEEEDPIEVVEQPPTDMIVLKTAIVAMVKKGPAPLKYWTARIIDQWSQNPRQGMPGTAKERRDAIGQLLSECVLVKQEREHPKGGQVREAVLDEKKAREAGYIA